MVGESYKTLFSLGSFGKGEKYALQLSLVSTQAVTCILPDKVYPHYSAL